MLTLFGISSLLAVIQLLSVVFCSAADVRWSISTSSAYVPSQVSPKDARVMPLRLHWPLLNPQRCRRAVQADHRLASSSIACLQVTLARACQVAYTGLLCLFTCLALFPVCLLRATMGPGVGIFTNLGVGVTVLQGQVTWSAVHGYRLLWKEVHAMHRKKLLPFGVLKAVQYNCKVRLVCIVI